jgi:hypothetical protein
MCHSRTHHSRTFLNTHPRGCSGRLGTVLPDDRLVDMRHAVGDAFPPIIGEIRPRRMVRASGKECGWTSCRSRRGNLRQALAWELVRLRGGGRQGATRGLPATASSGRSVTTRRYDQPDHPHRDKPVHSAPNIHRYSSQTPTQPPTPSEEHGQTGSLRRSHPGAQWNGGLRLSTGSLEPLEPVGDHRQGAQAGEL